VTVPVASLIMDDGRTEAANAARFVNLYSPALRYVVEWKEWIMWDGCRWERDVGGVGVQEKARLIAASLWGESREESERIDRTLEGKDRAARATLKALQRSMRGFVTASNSARGLAAMVKVATGMLARHFRGP
jgi:hypothetical protein